MMTVSSVCRPPAMPQNQRKKSCDDYDAITSDFPPPSLKAPQNDSEKRKKKEKKWSIGGLFRRKKKVSDTDSSSAHDDEEEKKGFLEKRRARKKRNRGSKDVTGSFEHVIINHPNRQIQNINVTSPDKGRSRELSNERLVGRSHESLAKKPESNLVRGSSVSLEGTGRRSGKLQIKARVEASRERLKVDSSSDEEGGSSRHSSSSVQKFRNEESTGSKDGSGSLSRRSRAARTERYKKRLSRDEESLKDFHSPPSRISRSDERLSNKKSEKIPASNRWTAKVVYYESSDYDTKYTAKTKSATPSPISSPKVRPKNTLHYTASAPPGLTYVTFPPSHVREGVIGSHQELRSKYYPSDITPRPHQRYTDVTPPRIPKSNSDVTSKTHFPNSIQRHYPARGQDILNRKSASYDSNVNSLHYVNNQITQPHPTDENVLVVQFPISRPGQKLDAKFNKVVTTPQQLVRQLNPPPPPPPRDPHRRLMPTNGYHHEASSRPMSYAFEDRNTNKVNYSGQPEFGSSISAFQRVPQVTPIDFEPVLVINRHHRSNSDHQISSRTNVVKNSPPISKKLVHTESMNRSSNPVNSDTNSVNTSTDVFQQTEVPQHYHYYTDQQPRSRKPIHITYQNQGTPNDSYLSDSQVTVKPPIQQVPRSRPPSVQNAADFWKQKDQESVKKVHLSEGSPKLIQRHLLHVSSTDARSRSNSPNKDNSTPLKLKLPPLIMPVRNTESTGSFSSQSSPRDIPTPRTPSGRNIVHNEIGIPVFENGSNNCLKREYRPMSMLEEKHETSEQEASPIKQKANNPPIPPTRRDSKVNAVTSFEHFDVFSDENDNSDGRKSSNLEDALNELEAIYKSLRLGEEGYLEKVAKEQAAYENNRLDPTNWNAWVQSRGFESDSSFNYSRSSLESVDSVDSPIKRSSSRRSGVPDRVADDMAYRRLNKKERPSPQEQEVISQVGSFLLVSPTLSPPPLVKAPPLPVSPQKNEPDITLDDVVYRNIKHVNNTLKVLDPQPPFGIPLGPITPAPNTDYLHVTPTETYRPTFKPRKIPDVVSDDLAFRNLRKDNNKEPLFTPEDTTLIDSPTLKKKRAVRSLSANLLSIIQKESMAINNTLIYNNNTVQNDLEKSQSFSDVTNVTNVIGPSVNGKFVRALKQVDMNVKKNLSGDDSDVTPRISMNLSTGTSSPLTATSTETLIGSRSSLLTQDSKVPSYKSSHSPSPRPSSTPERRHTVENIPFCSQNSASPTKHAPKKSESFKCAINLPKSELQRSPTPDNRVFTNQTNRKDEKTLLTCDQTESDLLALLAIETKQASEQLSKELNELSCEKNTNEKIELSPIVAENNNVNIQQPSISLEPRSNHSTSKSLPIGKIIPHKPVKLSTFCITEDNKLESKQTTVTNNPIEIEGSKSMTDLLKELTKSLDIDFGTSPDSNSKEVEIKESEDQSLPQPIEDKLTTDETSKQETKSDSKEHRTIQCKGCEENQSSKEVVPNAPLHEKTAINYFQETENLVKQIDSEDQLVSPTMNSFPLELPDDEIVKDTKSIELEAKLHCEKSPGVGCEPTSDIHHSRTVDSCNSKDSSTCAPDSSDSRPPGCSEDCPNLADEGTKSVADPRTLFLVCMACAHQLVGLDFLTILGLLLAMASLILFLVL